MNKITKEFLESEIISVEYNRLQGTLTHCAITTKSGFVFTGESACIDPNNFDKEIGEQVAYDSAFEKMWMPYGFWLHQKIRGEDDKPKETPVSNGTNTNKYRKKPVVIEAIQFVEVSRTPGKFAERIEYNDAEILDFVRSAIRVKTAPDVGNPLGKVSIQIPTLEGVMEAQVGDYIIKGVNGEFYPCKPDIFVKTYETVEPEQATSLCQKIHDEAPAAKNDLESILVISENECMDFGQAVHAMKAGIRVCRSGWNGKGMWLGLVHPDDDDIVPPRPTYAVAGIAGYATNGCLPWIGMKTADNKFVPWLASQTDVLAEDWQIAD